MKKDWETPREKLYNPKAEKAKALRFTLEQNRRVMEACKEEDEKWRVAEEQGGRKITKRRQEQAKKRANAVARKAVNRILVAQEQPEDKEVERRHLEAREEAKTLKEEKEMKRKNSKIMREIDYAKIISFSNTNNAILLHEEDEIFLKNHTYCIITSSSSVKE